MEFNDTFINDTFTAELNTTFNSTLAAVTTVFTTDFVQVTTTMTDVLSCSGGATLCSASEAAEKRCQNGGLCCTKLNIVHCVCPHGFFGKLCQFKEHKGDDNDYLLELLESRDRSIYIASLSSILGLVIGLLALIAIIIVAVFIIRKRIRMAQNPKKSVERHLSELQDELDRLPGVNKLAELTRLTRIFEESTVATAKTTVLFRDKAYGAAMQTAPLCSPEYTRYLPRWSSAPAILGSTLPSSQQRSGEDQVDAEFGGKKVLRFVFSVDETSTRGSSVSRVTKL